MLTNTQQKILIVGPAWVGDMVMAQALFKQLKTLHPNAQLDVIAPNYTGALLSRMPEIEKHLPLPYQHGELNIFGRRAQGRLLRSAGYSQAIVLPNSLKSALIPFWAKIPRRTGFTGEMRFGLLNDVRSLCKKTYPKMVERFVALAFPKKAPLPATLPRPKLEVSEEAKVSVLARHLPEFLLENDKAIVLCPGAEYGLAKRWPARYFAEIAKVKKAQGYQIWIIGSQKEDFIADEIQQLSDNICINFTGKTTLADAIDLIAVANSVVTNDSGLMHIAAALDKPIVAIYGSSSAGFTPPLSDNTIIVSENLSCRPCFKRTCPLGHMKCLNDLTPEKILHAMDKLS